MASHNELGKEGNELAECLRENGPGGEVEYFFMEYVFFTSCLTSIIVTCELVLLLSSSGGKKE